MSKKILNLIGIVIFLLLCILLNFNSILNINIFIISVFFAILLFFLLQKLYTFFLNKSEILSEKQNKIILLAYVAIHAIVFIIFNYKNLIKFDSNSIIIFLNFISLVLSFYTIYKFCRTRGGKPFSYFGFIVNLFILPFCFHIFKNDIRLFCIFIPASILYLLDIFDYLNIRRPKNIIIILLLYILFFINCILNKYSCILLFLISSVFLYRNKKNRDKAVILLIPLVIFNIISTFIFKYNFVNVYLPDYTKIYLNIFVYLNTFVIFKNIFVKEWFNKKIYFEYIYY